MLRLHPSALCTLSTHSTSATQPRPCINLAETRPYHYVALASLELTLWISLLLKSQRSTSLLPKAGIQGLCDQAQVPLPCYMLETDFPSLCRPVQACLGLCVSRIPFPSSDLSFGTTRKVMWKSSPKPYIHLLESSVPVQSVTSLSACWSCGKFG